MVSEEGKGNFCVLRVMGGHVQAQERRCGSIYVLVVSHKTSGA